MRNFFVLLVIAAAALSQTTKQQRPPASATEAMYQNAARSAERKVEYIRQNGARPNPDPRPTELTENEVNAYLNSGNVELPKGVSRVQLTGSDNRVTGTALVDFDKVTEGRQSSNPLLGLFSGTHDVEVTAQVVGINREGRVHIDSVAIDGIGVPRAALSLFVDRYVKPKHPELGLDSTFKLPSRIDNAVVGPHTVKVQQK